MEYSVAKTDNYQTGDASRVLVLAVTNAPLAIDDAGWGRFVRRQYILEPTDLLATAWASASTFRGSGKRGVANGSSIQLGEFTPRVIIVVETLLML